MHSNRKNHIDSPTQASMNQQEVEARQYVQPYLQCKGWYVQE